MEDCSAVAHSGYVHLAWDSYLEKMVLLNTLTGDHLELGSEPAAFSSYRLWIWPTLILLYLLRA
jgi:hypothetical protein